MKRLLFTILGAALFDRVSYALVELFALWYAPRYIKSDSDIGNSFMAALGLIVLCSIAGGVLGFRRTSRKAPAPRP
ncbi:hypothetical protein [Roseateles sp.]|uniref:hypothetical protein n=1 Tax=Roseateles sp. TaxID=1971397 RepID=UPI0031CDFE1A